MATAIAPREKQAKPEAMPKGGPVMPAREFPFGLGRLRDEFDRLFERFATAWPLTWAERMEGWRWGLDVRDKGDTLVVRAEAPGFEAADFDIQVQDGYLMLRACHKTETAKEGQEEWLRRECFESVLLPPGIDKDKVEARYHNGVLTVTIPKTPEGKGRKVAVKGE